MGKYENASILDKTDRILLIISGLCFLRPLVMLNMQFWISDLDDVIRGHSDVTYGFSSTVLDRMKIET